MKKKVIGVLAFQGSVVEHIEAARLAAINLEMAIDVVEVRTNESLKGIDGLIIPGGESTTLYKLCSRAGMWERMKMVKNIFGTCAGAIMLARTVHHPEAGQETLRLMDIEIDRNAYGSQIKSFSTRTETVLGPIEAVFIRAPRIKHPGDGVNILAQKDGEPVACEQKKNGRFYMAACFHPEFTTTLFHEYFLKKCFLPRY
jgi:pyridoxal 5'-phosphate synthase pdxT subunit